MRVNVTCWICRVNLQSSLTSAIFMSTAKFFSSISLAMSLENLSKTFVMVTLATSAAADTAIVITCFFRVAVSLSSSSNLLLMHALIKLGNLLLHKVQVFVELFLTHN